METEKEGIEKEARVVSPLSYLCDTVLGIERLRVRSEVRKSHLERQGREDKVTESILKDFQELEERWTQKLREEMEQHVTWPWLKRLRGIGLENSAKVVGLIEGVRFKSTGRSGIAAFDTMSKLRRFAGLAVIDGKAERKAAGEKIHYSQELKSMLWRVARQIKLGSSKNPSKFYNYYSAKKDEYTDRFVKNGCKILPTPQGRWLCTSCGREASKKVELLECCVSPSPQRVLRNEPPGVVWLGHVEALARRKMEVMFLDMLWKCWRGGLGLPCKPSYIVGKEPVRQHEPEDFVDD